MQAIDRHLEPVKSPERVGVLLRGVIIADGRRVLRREAGRATACCFPDSDLGKDMQEPGSRTEHCPRKAQSATGMSTRVPPGRLTAPGPAPK
jgi:uncharacterized protein (DUF427 family)